MSLLLNMLSRLVITFLPRSKRLLISWLQSPSAVILEPRKMKSDTVSTVSPSICYYMMGPDDMMGPGAMIFIFWMLNFKPPFPLSSFTFIRRLFSSSSLFAIRVVSSAYLRLLIFLPAILIPACTSSNLAFCMIYSAYKLNNQHNYIQPSCTPFRIWNQSVVPCPVLTVAWPAYRFLRRQIRWSGIPPSTWNHFIDVYDVCDYLKLDSTTEKWEECHLRIKQQGKYIYKTLSSPLTSLQKEKCHCICFLEAP